MGKPRAKVLIVLQPGTARTQVISGPMPDGRFAIVRWGDIGAIDLRRMDLDLVIAEARRGEATRNRRLVTLRRRLNGIPLLTFSRRRPRAGRKARASRDELATPLTSWMLEAILRRESRIASLKSTACRTARRLEQQESRLRALAGVVRATARDSEPRRLIELSMRPVSRYLRLRSWVFHLCDPEQGLLRVENRGGFERQSASATGGALDTGLAGRAARSRRPVTRRLREFPHPSATGRGGRSNETRGDMAVPLLSRGRVVGVLEVSDPPTAATRRAALAELITFLLEPAAVALDNALLLKKSEQLTCTDDLTKLYNSRFLNATLRREVERSRRYRTAVSLIFLDLDGFKVVNDEHGHLSGSRTLVEVGSVIRDTVREVDVVSRYGGDEFTVILPQTGPEGAAIIAERIRARIEEREFLSDYGLKVRLTASFGIASYPDHGSNKDDLIARADQAMYRVKGRGKNGVQVALGGDGDCVPVQWTR